VSNNNTARSKGSVAALLQTVNNGGGAGIKLTHSQGRKIHQDSKSKGFVLSASSYSFIVSLLVHCKTQDPAGVYRATLLPLDYDVYGVTQGMRAYVILDIYVSPSWTVDATREMESLVGASDFAHRKNDMRGVDWNFTAMLGNNSNLMLAAGWADAECIRSWDVFGNCCMKQYKNLAFLLTDKHQGSLALMEKVRVVLIEEQYKQNQTLRLGGAASAVPPPAAPQAPLVVGLGGAAAAVPPPAPPQAPLVVAARGRNEVGVVVGRHKCVRRCRGPYD